MEITQFWTCETLELREMLSDLNNKLNCDFRFIFGRSRFFSYHFQGFVNCAFSAPYHLGGRLFLPCFVLPKSLAKKSFF